MFVTRYAVSFEDLSRFRGIMLKLPVRIHDRFDEIRLQAKALIQKNAVGRRQFLHGDTGRSKGKRKIMGQRRRDAYFPGEIENSRTPIFSKSRTVAAFRESAAVPH